MSSCLIIVAKEPVAGMTKTRLAAGIGAANALSLYRCFLEDTVLLAKHVPFAQLAFSFWPPAAQSFFRLLDPQALLFPQSGAHFGDRLLSAFEQASQAGHDSIVLIGSDNPGLPSHYVEQAFEALRQHDIVLGPAIDGGYYLIGMHTPHPVLFHHGIAWSTDIVAQQTRLAAAQAGLRVALAPTWYDIDTGADLRRLFQDLLTSREHASAPATLDRLHALAHDGLADLLDAQALGDTTARHME